MNKVLLALALLTLTSCERPEPVTVCECTYYGVENFVPGWENFFNSSDITNCDREGEIIEMHGEGSGYLMELKCKEL